MSIVDAPSLTNRGPQRWMRARNISTAAGIGQVAENSGETRMVSLGWCYGPPIAVRHVQNALQRHFADVIDLSDLPGHSLSR